MSDTTEPMKLVATVKTQAGQDLKVTTRGQQHDLVYAVECTGCTQKVWFRSPDVEFAKRKQGALDWGSQHARNCSYVAA